MTSYALRRARPRRPAGPAVTLPWLLAAVTVGLQIAYPLVEGEPRRQVTVAVVVAFFLTCVAHAAVHRGPRWALTLVVVTAGGGFTAEAVGVRTGVPFGEYAYAGTLGPELAGVPLVVPLAWTMIAYPVLLAARRLTGHATVLVGALGMVAWDVFLDPQMVQDGHWRWADPQPGLPGVEGVPLTNYAGWCFVGLVLMLVLSVVLPRDDPPSQADESVPALLLGWTWVGYVLGNLFWFGTPSVAVVGGLALGLLVVPYLWSLWQSRA